MRIIFLIVICLSLFSCAKEEKFYTEENKKNKEFSLQLGINNIACYNDPNVGNGRNVCVGEINGHTVRFFKDYSSYSVMVLK